MMINPYNDQLFDDCIELAEELGDNWVDEVSDILNEEHVDTDYLYVLRAGMRVIKGYRGAE